MAVSAGFYKKIHDWVIDDNTGGIAFRPFQVNGNPYKSKVFLVGLNTEPLAERNINDVKQYADSLVDQQLFQSLNEQYIKDASREYKGALNFALWMKETFGEDVVISNLNTYVANDYEKNVKGKEIFYKVLNEFKPSIIILHGSKTAKLFLEQFSEELLLHTDITKPVQQLEHQGAIADLELSFGKCKVFACRNMSYFGKSGTTFGNFKEILEESIQSIKK